MAVTFPSNPSEGDTFTNGNNTFIFTNGVWDSSNFPSNPEDINYTYPSGDQQTLQNRLEQSISVIDFGAVGDGENDDTAAIQACFDYCYNQFSVDTYLHDFIDPYTEATQNTRFQHNTQCIKVVFPPGKTYRITDTINLTDWRFQHSVWYVEARGAVFMLEMAGKPAFDLLRSRKCSWFGGNFTSVGDPVASKSSLVKCVFQLGRDSQGQASDTHRFSAIDIKGYYSWAGIYNFCSEDCYFDGVNIKNDWNNSNAYCFIQDSHNIWGVTSEFVDSPKKYDLGSFLRNTFIRCDFRRRYAGGTVWMGSGCVYHQFIASYLVGTCPSANPRTRLVTFYSAPSLITPTNIRTEINNHLFDIHVESDEGDSDPATGLDVAFYLSGELTVLYKATGGEVTIESDANNYPEFTLEEGSVEITKISDANPSGELLTLGVDYTVNDYTDVGTAARFTLTTPLQGPDLTANPPKTIGDVIAIGNQTDIKESTLSNFTFHDRNTHSQKYIFERNRQVFDNVVIRACDIKTTVGRDSGQTLFDTPTKYTLTGKIVNLSDPSTPAIPLVNYSVPSTVSTLTSGVNGVPVFDLTPGEELVEVDGELMSPEVDYTFNGDFTKINLTNGISDEDNININVNGSVVPDTDYSLAINNGNVINVDFGVITSGDNVVLKINNIRQSDEVDYVLNETTSGNSRLIFTNNLTTGQVVNANSSGSFGLQGAVFNGDYYCRDARAGQSSNSLSSYRIFTDDSVLFSGDDSRISKLNGRSSLKFYNVNTYESTSTTGADIVIEANTSNKRITFKLEDENDILQNEYIFSGDAFFQTAASPATLGSDSSPWADVVVDQVTIKNTGTGSDGVLTVVNGQLLFNGNVIS